MQTAISNSEGWKSPTQEPWPVPEEQPKYELPARLWQFAEHALADLEAVEQDPRYEVEMGVWHSPAHHNNGKCVVCFAGAVMAKTYQVPPTWDLSPSEMACNSQERRALCALDALRQGHIDDAVENYHMHLMEVDSLTDEFFDGRWDDWPQYNPDNPERFKAYVRDVIEFLKSKDL